MGNLLPPLFGWLAARRLLREEDPLAAAATGWALGWALFLLGVNTLYRLASLEWALGGTLGLMVLAGGVLLARTPPAPRLRASLSRAAEGTLATMAGLVYLYTNASQALAPDGDYWIHTALQGMMARGTFPPVHPFIADVPLHGHYGRDLLVAAVARLGAGDVFRAQFLLTTLFQVATLVLLFTALRRATGSELQALLGTGMAFFGVNVGARAGLLDTFQNNNPVVHLYLALLVDLTLRAWAGSRPAALLGGAVLGSYGFVYTSHFGLMLLCLPLAGGILGIPPRLLLLLPLLGLGIAITQGGPARALLEPSPSRSVAEAGQTQALTPAFPKEPLFQVYLTGEPWQQISAAARIFGFRPSAEEGYRPLWSPELLRLHWLPLFLSPLTGLYLVRRRHRAAVLLWSFGALAFLVPGLADFGPVYELDSFRWEFASGLGLAVALGLAAGSLAEERLPPASVPLPSGNRLLPAGVLAAVVAAVTLAVPASLARLAEAPLPRGFLPPLNSSAWVESQAVLGFRHADWEAARWLARRVKPGDRILVDSGERDLLFDSTLAGVCGAQPVGRTFPTEADPPGTPPFRQAAFARAFWETLDPGLLRGWSVDWVYTRRKLPGLKAVYPGVYRVESRPLSEKTARIRSVALRDGPPPLRGGVVWRLAVEVDGPPAATMHYRIVRRSDGRAQPAPDRLPQPVGDTLVVVTPLEEGSYDLLIGGRKIPLTIDFPSRLKRLKVRHIEPLGPLRAGVPAAFRVRAAGPPLGVEEGMLGAVVDSASPEPEAYLAPVRFRVPAGGEAEFRALGLLPRAGECRLDLVLIPREGGRYRFPGPTRARVQPSTSATTRKASGCSRTARDNRGCSSSEKSNRSTSMARSSRRDSSRVQDSE